MVMAGFFVFAQGAEAEIAVPPLKGRVNDYAGMLTSRTIQDLEAQLSALETSDSTQVVVLTVNSLEGEAIETFSIRVAEAWKIGQKDLDNGAIFIVSKQDRKLRIEAGYGLEGRLTDLIAGQIIRNVVVPEFKRGDFNQGISAGVGAMISVVRGEYKGSPVKHRSRSKSQGPLFAILAFVFLVSQLGRANKGLGAVAGGIMLPVFGGMFFGGGLVLLLILFPIGLLSGLILSAMGSSLGSHMVSSHSYRGGGGFGGGGFGGGGFGGFSGGGGGFGGGGASGGW
ncbi:MAG: TPM domain-containing protein [Proteobacteria bacterium]|nr:TPM domain-containing protein [Pseudomonadota bacterium]